MKVGNKESEKMLYFYVYGMCSLFPSQLRKVRLEKLWLEN